MFKKIIVPLLKINTNVYVFSSGILVSLATNIFTSLCDKSFNIVAQWQEFSSTVLFVVAGALSMFIGVKIANVQEYFKEHKKELEKSNNLIEDIYGHEKGKWCLYYLSLIFSLVGGVAMLVLNWIMYKI